MLRTSKLYVSRYLPRMAALLDRQPLSRVIMMGVVLGLGLGAPGLIYLRSPAWLLLWGVLFVALWRVAYSAEPVFEENNPMAVEAGPKRVRDGPLLMVDLPGGRFLMGSPDTDEMAHDNEKPQRLVTVSGFRIAVTPVTVGLYNQVMQKEPASEEAVRLPVADVNWYDAVEFCNRLSAREGYRPCYRQRWKRWVCDWRADGYRLPTEAEWEYACRAGAPTRYTFGDDSGRLGDYAWFVENASGRTHEVAQKRPNNWGLYDMHGNVWEWCWDGYKLYSLWGARDWNARRNFFLPPYRVVRGGSFVDSPGYLYSAYRFGVRPAYGLRRHGFRCVRIPRLQPLDP